MKKLTYLLAPFLAAAAFATVTSYSPPVGGMTISVPAGQTRTFSLPLLHESVGAGKMIGKITGVGTNYIDVSDANWTPGALSSSSNPYYLHILSGAARGRVLVVSTTANTATRLYVNNDGVDLVQSSILGGADGDEYEIILTDVLGSLFGSTTLQGASSAASADNVVIWGGASWLTFYYNTDRNRWERSTDIAASPSRDTYVLRPDRGFMITRRAATALTMYVVGRVPTKAPRLMHSSPGVTFFTNGLPVDMTLGSLGLQSRATGWLKSTSGTDAVANADYLQVWGGASWLTFYYNSDNNRWQRTTDVAASPSRDTYIIPAGRPFMVRRIGTPAAVTDKLIDVPMTYTISM